MKSIYLFLSLVTGIMEFGSGLALFAGGHHPAAAVFVCAMYQLGNLLPDVLPRLHSRKASILTGVIGFLCGAAALFLHGMAAVLLFGCWAALSSVCIQNTRDANKGDCRTSVKRSFRIAGMLLTFLCTLFPAILPACTFAALVCIPFSGDKWVAPHRQGSRKPVCLTMVFHQFHYFVYTYFMPLYVFTRLNARCGFGGAAILTALLLAVSWVVYALPGEIMDRREGRYAPRKVFFACHSLLAVLMAALTAAVLCERFLPAVIIWLLTGAGGGSVGCIKELNGSMKQKYDMDLSEDIGHFGGAAVSCAVALALGMKGTAVCTGLSCCFVVTAILLALRERK